MINIELYIKKIILIFIIIFAFQSSNSQDYKDLFIEAEYHFMYDDYKEALPYYLRILSRDSTNSHINYKTALCYLYSSEITERNNAYPHLLKAIQNISTDFKEGNIKERNAPKEAYFHLANLYRYNYDFNKAIFYYQKLLELIDVKDIFYFDYINRQIETTFNAKELISFRVKVHIDDINERLGFPDNIGNCPIISNNEKVLIYSTGKKNILSADLDIDTPYEEEIENSIFFSIKQQGQWSPPRNITKELGVKRIAYPVSINETGDELYIVQNDRSDGNIYVSYYKNNRWTKMTKLNKNINTRHWESHASLSQDGKSLYFTSDKPGGYGGLDIYVSHRTENGDWGPSTNLGPTINTKWNEETPFILQDNKTLYFSSQGHYNMGGFDIFFSTMLDSNTWASPLNLGYPINSVNNDIYYLPIIQGEYTFYSLRFSERGISKNEIFRIEAQVPKQLVSEIYLKGKIMIEDKRTYLPNDFSILLIDSISGDTIFNTKPDIYTGNYSFEIKSGNYIVQYKGKGYYPHYESIFIPNIFTQTEITKNIVMKAIPPDITTEELYVEKTMFFEIDESDLISDKKDLIAEINLKGKIVLENPDDVIPNNFTISIIDALIGDTISTIQPDINTRLFTTSIKRGNYIIRYKGENYITQYDKLTIPENFNRKDLVLNVEMVKIKEDSDEFFVLRNIEFGKEDIKKDDLISMTDSDLKSGTKDDVLGIKTPAKLEDMIDSSLITETTLAEKTTDSYVSPTSNIKTETKYFAEIILKGRIKLQDNKNELPHDFSILIIDRNTSKTITNITPDLISGNYSTKLSSNNFRVQYKGNGYLTHYENIFLPERYTQPEIVLNVDMQPLEVSSGDYYAIKNLYFDFDKSILRRESQFELQKLANIMKQNPSLQVEVIGHTDHHGSYNYNQILSERRAKAAINYLSSLGIEKHRFVSKGMGKKQYIATNDSPEGRQLNRRVEIKIINPDKITIKEDINIPDHLKYKTPDSSKPSINTYTILVNKSNSKLKELEKFNEILIDKTYYYTYGNYSHKAEALKDLTELIEKGYTSAEIYKLSFGKAQ